MEHPIALPLSILRASSDNTIEGITRMQKLVFLAQENLDEVGNGLYNFDAYDYGPFSKELYADIDSLANRGFIEQETVETNGGNEKKVYTITDRGEKYLEYLDEQPSTGQLEELTSEYEKMPLLQLIKRVYTQNPKMAVNSKLEGI